MLAIWANKLVPQALKSCPNCNKLPNLFTLSRHSLFSLFIKLNERLF